MKLVVDNVITKVVIGGADNMHGNLMKEFREYMSVKQDGAMFMQKYARKKGKYMGDGMQYFITPLGKMATGFIPYLLKFFEQYNLQYTIEDKRTNLPKFKAGELDLQLPMYKLAPHQADMIEAVNRTLYFNDTPLYFPRGIWDVAPNGGKTAAFAGLIQNVENPRAILMVHSKDLQMQHYEYFSKIFDDVGLINDKNYHIGTTVTIGMYKTMYNRMQTDLSVERDFKTKFNIKAVDECHRASATEYSKLNQGINAGMVVFMSGNPLDKANTVSNFKTVGLSGNVIIKVTKAQLIDMSVSLRPEVKILLNPCKAMCMAYDEEVSRYITGSDDRAELIANLIKEKRGKKILVTFFYREHGELMYNAAKKANRDYAHRIDWVHGQDKERAAKIQAFRDGETMVLFTSNIMQEGIDIPDIEVVVYASGGKGQIAPSQFSGRGERKDGVNTSFEFYDIFDAGQYLAAHSAKRIKSYKDEGFEIKYNYEQHRNGHPKKQK